MKDRAPRKKQVKSGEFSTKKTLIGLVVVGMLGLSMVLASCGPSLDNQLAAAQTQGAALSTELAVRQTQNADLSTELAVKQTQSVGIDATAVVVKTAQAEYSQDNIETATALANPTAFADLLARVNPEVRGATVQVGFNNGDVSNVCTAEVLSESQSAITLNDTPITLYSYIATTAHHCLPEDTTTPVTGFISTAEDTRTGAHTSVSFPFVEQLGSSDAVVVSIYSKSDIAGIEPLSDQARNCSDISVGDTTSMYGFPSVTEGSEVTIPNFAPSLSVTEVGETITVKSEVKEGRPFHAESGGGLWKNGKLCGVLSRFSKMDEFLVARISQEQLETAIKNAQVFTQNAVSNTIFTQTTPVAP